MCKNREIYSWSCKARNLALCETWLLFDESFESTYSKMFLWDYNNHSAKLTVEDIPNNIIRNKVPTKIRTPYITFQHKLARRAWAEVYRGVVDIVHDIRVPGADGVLCSAVRYPIRQELESTASRPAPSRLRRAACAAASTHQPLAGGVLSSLALYSYPTTILTT